jgi:hypothetical protein
MCSTWIERATHLIPRLTAALGLLLAVGATGCGEEATLPVSHTPSSISQSGVVVTSRGIDTHGLPGCDSIGGLPAGAQVVVSRTGRVAVVYDQRQALCTSSVSALYNVGLLGMGDLLELGVLTDGDPAGSGDPIPAMSDHTASGDPIPAHTASHGDGTGVKGGMMGSASAGGGGAASHR